MRFSSSHFKLNLPVCLHCLVTIMGSCGSSRRNHFVPHYKESPEGKDVPNAYVFKVTWFRMHDETPGAQGFYLHSEKNEYDEGKPWARIIADGLPEATAIVAGILTTWASDEYDKAAETLRAEWCVKVNEQLADSGVRVDTYRFQSTCKYEKINASHLAIRIRIP
jgi:hypothetical protein